MDLQFRPFGPHMHDLDVDFRRTERPQLVTAILAACIQPAGRALAEQIQDWTLSERLEKLLHIAFASRPGPLRARVNCIQPGCGQAMEIEFSEAELLAAAPPLKQDTVEIQIQGQTIRLHRPRAKDQYQWLGKSYASESEAAATILRTLAYPPDELEFGGQGLNTAVLEKISQTMEAFDPLVAYKTRVACPDCGQAQTEEIDLEALALKRLQVIQQELLLVIHRLAGYYHWSEQDILHLPAWRRQYYLAKIEREQEL